MSLCRPQLQLDSHMTAAAGGGSGKAFAFSTQRGMAEMLQLCFVLCPHPETREPGSMVRAVGQGSRDQSSGPTELLSPFLALSGGC